MLSLHGFPKQPSVPWKSKGQNTELWPAGPALCCPLSSAVATRFYWSPLSGLKGVQPLPFGERTRDCSPGAARWGSPAFPSPVPGPLMATPNLRTVVIYVFGFLLFSSGGGDIFLFFF